MSSQHAAVAGQQQQGDRQQTLSSKGGTQAAGSSWLTSTITSNIDSLYQRAENWLYDILQQSSDVHVAVKLLALSGALLPLIFLSGLVYNRASGVPLSQSLYKMYCLLYRVEGVHEPNVPAYLVSNVVFLLGFFTLALLLGVVNDEVQRRSDDARCGRNPVHAEGHVLLLNWNSNSPALLHSIALAEAAAASHARRQLNQSFWASRPSVVVLADKDKSEMDAAVQECVKDRGLKLQVHTRQGSVFKPSHLRKVSASEASTIILLHPDHVASSADAEAMKAAAAMCFKTLEQRHAGKAGHSHQQRAPQRMIVQMPSSVQSSGNIMRSIVRQSAAAAAAQGSDQQQLQLQVLAMPDDTLVNRIIAQTAAQPGVLTVWQDILTTEAHSSNLTCPLLPPEQEHLPYQTIRRCYGDAVCVGFLDPSGQVQLNPPDDSRPGPGSHLILLHRAAVAAAAVKRADGAASAPERFAASAVAAAQRLHGGSAYRPRPRRILVAAWSRRAVPELMRSLVEFTPTGSSVMFVLDQAPERSWLKEAARGGGNCRISFITDKYPTGTETLLSAGIRSADTVVLGTGSGEPTDQEADARVLAALLQLQEAVLSSGRRAAPHVVCPIREHGSSAMAIRYLNRVARQMRGRGEACDDDDDDDDKEGQDGGSSAAAALVLRPEFLVFRDVTSAVLAHVVSEPAYADIITELLFSGEGQEMYLRSPASFNIPLGVPISFAEVAELARLTKQTAIGLCRDKHFLGPPAAGAAGLPGQELGSSSSSSPAAARKPVRSLSAAAEVELALPGSQLITFAEGDFIVCLARDFIV